MRDSLTGGESHSDKVVKAEFDSLIAYTVAPALVVGAILRYTRRGSIPRKVRHDCSSY